jgi:DNA-binding winged helix-turn-helix (wHTH) protein/TolB-like protein/Flp pilus assembly protein TadD
MVTRQWSSRHAFVFGPFQLETTERILLRDGQEVPLTPKLFDTLLVLVESNGRILEKDELLQKVWPDTIVEEGTLTKTISMLRKILGGEEGTQAYIETLPKRGYRFVAEVREVSNAPPELALQSDTETVEALETHIERAAPPQSTAGDADALSLPHPRHPTLSRRWAWLAALLLIGLAITAYHLRLKQAQPPAVFKSIAVLPFKPLVADRHDESLEMGMADTLIRRLSNLQGITVRPISTVRKYSALEQDPVEAGREMSVDAVLDGNIQRSGDRIRITVRLLNVKDGHQVWQDQYDQKMTDIFSIQDSISTRAAALLALKLSGTERELLTRRYTDNTEAYQAYLKGRYYTSKFTREGFNQGIEYLNQAIAIDPNYALAYEGLAYYYYSASDWLIPPREAVPQLRAAANKALQLDNTLATAHVWLAVTYYVYDRDPVAAETEYKRAIELNPTDVTLHEAYGLYLMMMQRFDQAIAETRRARELEPLSPEANTVFGMSFYFDRQYDQAIEQLHFTNDIEPNYWLAYYHLGRAFMRKGQLAEAIAAFKKARLIDDRNAPVLSALGCAYAMAGDKTEAQKALDDLSEQSKQNYVSPYSIAMIHFALGDKDQGFTWLDKAYEDRSQHLFWLKVDPELDPLRSDPRFTELLKRLDLPQ